MSYFKLVYDEIIIHILGQRFSASGHNWTLFEKYLPLMPLENENQLSSPLSEISKTIEKLGESLDPKVFDRRLTLKDKRIQKLITCKLRQF